MKNAAFLLLLLIPFACSKDITISMNSISGLWTLNQISGGITGTVPMPSGINTIAFESSGQYSKAVDNVMQESGMYTITLKKTIFSEQKMNVLHFMPSQNNSYDMAVDLNGNILSLMQDAYDGVNYVYAKHN
jgi:hypothetical protein